MDRSRFRFPAQPFLQLLNHFQPSLIRYCRRLFVNRNLRLAKIQAVGFDMDYTLAIYRRQFDFLAWDLALGHLVGKYGFPPEVMKFRYDPSFAIRGLVIDMVNGNIFKLDRHRHVSRAYHGTRPVTSETRNELYRRRRLVLSSPRYFLVDTLFSLPETHMYAQMVDLLDRTGRASPGAYEQSYRSIRTAVDEIHRDGSLKERVKQSFSDYVEKELDMAWTLERFKFSDKKLFLVTNSGWDYTHATMSFLLDGVLDAFPRWTDYFDLVFVDARKPVFFGRGSAPRTVRPAQEDLQDKVFEGGNLRSLETRLGYSGDSILYVGDHVYGDILRSKKSSTWRTAMIIPEMETELEAIEETREEQDRFDRQFAKRRQFEVELNYQQRLLVSLMQLEGVASGNGQDSLSELHKVAHASEHNVSLTRNALDRLEQEIAATEAKIQSSYNPIWGMLFKEGSEHSVFGEQVEDYACVYTSRLSNFLSYSPLHYFRTSRDLLSHERNQ